MKVARVAGKSFDARNLYVARLPHAWSEISGEFIVARR